MFFISLEFLLFSSLAFILYWPAARFGTQPQNAVSALIGLGCCACLHPLFAGLLLLEALAAFVLARLVDVRRTRVMLSGAIICLLTPLLVFKYYNFFVDSLHLTNLHADILALLLPLGISFYTFMAVGYVIDVYRRTVAPEKNLLAFLAFMTFFPQLTAGPIGRATTLLPQFTVARRFDAALATDGCRQILWGAFKKAVVADLAASAVAPVFANPAQWNALTLWLGALLFTIQIYADFSGYSDMAIGLGKLFGVTLPTNFRTPYFATNIADFWRNWHISLTTWFRDYVYIPLGGSRCATALIVRNTLIVFLVSGLWHGAAWTFVLWGLVHGLFFVPRLCLKSLRLPTPVKGFLTFFAVMLAWILFRTPSLDAAGDYFAGLVSTGGLGLPPRFLDCLPYAALLFGAEYWKRGATHPLGLNLPRAARWGVYFLLILLIFFARPQTSQFIYAQF